MVDGELLQDERATSMGYRVTAEPAAEYTAVDDNTYQAAAEDEDVDC
jgi:hypothetical protein